MHHIVFCILRVPVTCSFLIGHKRAGVGIKYDMKLIRFVTTIDILYILDLAKCEQNPFCVFI